MHIHARAIKYFDMIRRSGSIREAARRLHVASSAVNRQLLQLEEEIGSPLFERMTQGLRLTPAGEVFSRHVITVLQDEVRLRSDMLFLAQTENDPRNLRLGEIDLAELIRGLFDYFEALAEDRNITLYAKGAAEPIRADREMLLRALNNLLSNAIRHTPYGSRITVALAQDERWTTISVENPGERISEADLPKLFDRFFRVDPARQRKNAGAGLGLAIVKSIAEAHGGHVQATSSDTATKFDLTLPRIA